MNWFERFMAKSQKSKVQIIACEIEDDTWVRRLVEELNKQPKATLVNPRYTRRKAKDFDGDQS